MVFDQHANETLERTQNRAMQHHRRNALIVSVDKLGAQALRHREINLNRAALPVASDGVFERVLNLGAIKGAFTGRYFKVTTCPPQAFH